MTSHLRAAKGGIGIVVKRFDQTSRRGVLGGAVLGFGGPTTAVSAQFVRDLGLQHSIDELASSGGILDLPADAIPGRGQITVRSGVTLAGRGTAHHAYYSEGLQKGSSILQESSAGGYAMALQSAANGYGGFGLRDLSIYHQGRERARAVLHIAGVQRPQLANVEIGTLDGAKADYGLLIEPSRNGNLSLYGLFSSIYTPSENGSAHATGLGIFEDSNALAFVGGSFQGRVAALEIGGTRRAPTALSFAGCAFEGAYTGEEEHMFLPGGRGLFGADSRPPSDCYIVKLVKISRARGVTFSGCYFELGGVPQTYDDGVNGRHPLYSVIALEGPEVSDVTVEGLETCLLYDGGAIGTRAALRSGQTYDTRSGPSLSIRNLAPQSVPSFVEQTIKFSGPDLISRPGLIAYDRETGIGRVLTSGCFRIEAVVSFNGFDARHSFCHVCIHSDNGNARGANALVDASAGAPLTLSASLVTYLEQGQQFWITARHGSGQIENLVADADYNGLSVYRIA